MPIHGLTDTNNPSFRRLCIFGAGGFGRELAWLAQQIWGSGVRIEFLVDHPEFLTGPVNGMPVSLSSDLEPDDDTRVVVALGDGTKRRQIAVSLASAGHRPATLIHPRVEISPWVELGEGTVICANSVVTCNVTIGKHVHINLGCTIGHDVVIGDYATLSPGANVSGNVHIGRGVFVGTNACFINGRAGEPLLIGDGAVIAAGACVVKDVPAHTLVAGVPAVVKHKR